MPNVTPSRRHAPMPRTVLSLLLGSVAAASWTVARIDQKQIQHAVHTVHRRFFMWGWVSKPINMFKDGLFGGNGHSFASYSMTSFWGGFGICCASGIAVRSGFKTCLARFAMLVEAMSIPAAVTHFNQHRGKRSQQELAPSSKEIAILA